MGKFIEVLKANKGKILKRGLIAFGAVVGLTVASKMLLGAGNAEFSEALPENVEDVNEEENDENQDEEE